MTNIEYCLPKYFPSCELCQLYKWMIKWFLIFIFYAYLYAQILYNWIFSPGCFLYITGPTILLVGGVGVQKIGEILDYQGSWYPTNSFFSFSSLLWNGYYISTYLHGLFAMCNLFIVKYWIPKKCSDLDSPVGTPT